LLRRALSSCLGVRLTWRALALVVAVAFLLPAVAACSDSDGPEGRSYILTTASTGGTYYPVGVAISTLVKLRLQETNGISLSAINSAGSGENIKLLHTGEADFALVQGLFGIWAKTGEGAYGRRGGALKLRSITMLWPNVEHFIIDRSLVESGTLSDLSRLKGATFAVGNRNSGAAQSTRMIFDSLGLRNGRNIKFAYLSYSAAADALRNGTIAGFSAPAGAPVSAVARAFAASGESITLLGVTDEERARFNKEVGLWSPFLIAANTYPGLGEAIRTAAQPNFLAVNADVDEEVVYKITRVIFENLPFLHSVHRATRSISLNTAVQGLPVPLHPGAVRYYREQGIALPQNLIVEPADGE
jgi:TRAP transporter TAXI family solute receptor